MKTLTAIVLPGLLCSLAGCVTPPVPAIERFEFNREEMGVPFRIVFYSPDRQRAGIAAEDAFRRIHELNSILSDYDAGSELSRLSRTSGSGQWVTVSEDLWIVLARAQEVAQLTDGAFDMTVGPCVQLWRKARREQRLPDAQRLATALKSVGFRYVLLDPQQRRVQLTVPDMRLDAGGIAKGYAVDEAMRVLRKRGIRSALVAGGGDIAVSSPPPGRKGWRVELGRYDVPNAPLAPTAEIARRGLATSGDVFQRLEIDGQRYSHIVDPRTGIGLLDHSLVTVIAPDCMTADIWATALSVMGPAAGFRLSARQRNLAVKIIRENEGRIEMRASRNFDRYDRESRN